MTLSEFLTLLFVGLVAGFLAGAVMKGGGYGLFGNVILGVVGAVLGGFLAGMLGVSAYGVLGRIVVATFGAIVLIGLARVLRGSPASSKS